MNLDDFIADPNALSESLAQPIPITWRIDPADPDRTLTAADAEWLWEELRDWVEWLVERYSLDHRIVPPCWFLHGALVDELTALWGAWQVAYGRWIRPPTPPTGCRSSPTPAPASPTGPLVEAAAPTSTAPTRHCQIPKHGIGNGKRI